MAKQIQRPEMNVKDIFDWYCARKNFAFDETFTNEFGFSIFDKESNFHDNINYGDQVSSPKAQKLSFALPLIAANDKNFRSKLEKVIEKSGLRDFGATVTVLDVRDTDNPRDQRILKPADIEHIKKTYETYFPDETDLIITVSYPSTINLIARKEYLKVKQAKKP